MKKLKAFLLAGLLAATASAQDINKNDAAGKRHGMWKGIYEQSKRPRYEGTFEHGKETGAFKFFEDEEGSPLAATRVFAKDGSCFTTFYEPSGTKVSEGREVNKERTGEWKFYHYKSKAVMSVELYKQGKLNGVRKVFFPDGKLAEETNYVNGIKQGAYKKYTEKGVLLEETIYVDDQYHGMAIFRDGNGNTVSEGRYKNGKKAGVWKFYENGKLKKEQNMNVLTPRSADKSKKG